MLRIKGSTAGLTLFFGVLIAPLGKAVLDFSSVASDTYSLHQIFGASSNVCAEFAAQVVIDYKSLAEGETMEFPQTRAVSLADLPVYAPEDFPSGEYMRCIVREESVLASLQMKPVS